MQMPHIEAEPAKEGTASLNNGKNSTSVTNVSVPTATSCKSTMAEFLFPAGTCIWTTAKGTQTSNTFTK